MTDSMRAIAVRPGVAGSLHARSVPCRRSLGFPMVAASWTSSG
jgi:hypothetical protein